MIVSGDKRGIYLAAKIVPIRRFPPLLFIGG